MTAQVNDTVWYRNRQYTLAGFDGTGLFEPADHGIEPVVLSTACYRGFYCTYDVADNTLFLLHLNIGADRKVMDRYITKLKHIDTATIDLEQFALENVTGPTIFGKTAQRYTERGWSKNLHTGEVRQSWPSDDFVLHCLKEPMSFTGGILIGDRLIGDMRVHMGFPAAYKFRILHELIFQAGVLIREADRSSEMAEFRKDLCNKPVMPEYGATFDDIHTWVARCFNRNYKWH